MRCSEYYLPSKEKSSQPNNSPIFIVSQLCFFMATRLFLRTVTECVRTQLLMIEIVKGIISLVSVCARALDESQQSCYMHVDAERYATNVGVWHYLGTRSTLCPVGTFLTMVIILRFLFYLCSSLRP